MDILKVKATRGDIFNTEMRGLSERGFRADCESVSYLKYLT